MAKLIHTNGPFEVYRRGQVLIIQRDGEFFCNQGPRVAKRAK